jgi:hypothetical protein
VAELCQTDIAYRWLSGDLRPNYHALSDFRSGGGKQLTGSTGHFPFLWKKALHAFVWVNH